jgi:hypothetical protein
MAMRNGEDVVQDIHPWVHHNLMFESIDFTQRRNNLARRAPCPSTIGRLCKPGAQMMRSDRLPGAVPGDIGNSRPPEIRSDAFFVVL